MPHELSDDLARAISGDEIVPHFQPLVELRTGHLSGFEVLARWYHPIRGIVHPAEFIPIAEQTGLIGPLTERLLLNAASAAAAWPEHLTLSVNVSPVQLRDRGMAERLHAAIDGTGFPFDRLMFEITETMVIENHNVARGITGDLKALGAKLSLDDFGTGHANLRQLLALRFDRLKIDASFVRSMLTRGESRKVVASVIGLGHSLGMSTVAEGVEGQDEADMLISLGCDIGQGWLYGRPVPANEITTQLSAENPPWRLTQSTARIAADMAHRLEALPSQSVGQLRALYDSGPVGLGLVDTNLRYVALNRRLAEMHDMTVVAHQGRTVAEVLPHIYDQLEPNLRLALSGQAVSGFVSHWQGPGGPGDEHVLVASYQPVRDAANEVVGVSIAVVDITELDRARNKNKQFPGVTEPGQRIPGLTPRQSDVMRLLATGRSVKEIARELDLGIGTVKSHLAKAYRILGARNRTEAMLRSGLAVDGAAPKVPR
jgi:PAS domain S-box-containing protein